jgi:hypothetical protein
MKSPLFAALLTLAPTFGAEFLKTTETNSAITITHGANTVLVYHKADLAPPEGVKPIYKRSGFIHPLCTPAGFAITGIHPPDHYHHLGLFHAWVQTKHGEDKIDFWNLDKATGRVRYASTISITKGEQSKATGFSVKQEHVAYKGKEKKETVVLEEIFTITAESMDGHNVITYDVAQTNITDTALTLPVFRYGGCLGWRGPHTWNKDNSTIRTSEGKGRDDSHTTRAKWIAYEGSAEKDQVTFAVLIHPDNHDCPQRLRTWTAKDNNGAPFLSICPVQEKPWEITPKQTIKMRYTLITCDGTVEVAKIDEWWNKLTNRKAAE